MEFGFSKNSGRYTNLETGRFVPRDLIFGELNADVQRFTVRANRLAKQLTDGKISTTTFSRLLREELKPLLTRSSALGAGGMSQLEGKQLSQLGNGARKTYSSLKYLTDQIKRGELTPGQIAERARRLGSNAYGAFHRAEQLSRVEGGFLLGWRHLGFNINHCADCLTLRTQGYLPINEITPIGDGCVCGGRCHCQITYKKASPEEIARFTLGTGSFADQVLIHQVEVMQSEQSYDGLRPVKS
jgi:hypothetical protein